MITFLALAFLTGYGSPTSVSAEPSRIEADVGDLGSCLGDKGIFELRRIMFLTNRTIDIDSAGKFRVTLDRQKVKIQRLSGASGGEVHIVNVGNIISGEPDIVLTLGILDNRPVLYWRETFLHRRYRQGVFSIVGQSLVLLCQGSGGVDLTD